MDAPYTLYCIYKKLVLKDNVDTAFIIGIVFIVLNVIFFQFVTFGFAVSTAAFCYVAANESGRALVHVLLILGTHKRSSNLILVWMIMIGLLIITDLILGKYLDQSGYRQS